MAFGVVSAPKPAYQGSGLDTAVKQETPAVDISPSAKPEAPAVAEAEPAVTIAEPHSIQTEDGHEKQEQLTQIEIQESKRNDSVKRAVEEINRKAKNSEAIFGVHDATNRVTIKIVDKDTREVLKEYPPEETLDMIAKVWELAGIMIDERG